MPDAFDLRIILTAKRAAFHSVGFGGVHGFSVLNKSKVGRVFNVFHTLGILYVIFFKAMDIRQIPIMFLNLTKTGHQKMTFI